MATKRLVEADSQARQESLEAQQSLDDQCHERDDERKQLAQERRTDPVIANSISAAAILIACILPLALAIYVLRNLGPQTTDDGWAELLVQEMTSDQPILLPRLNQLAGIESIPPTALPVGE